MKGSGYRLRSNNLNGSCSRTNDVQLSTVLPIPNAALYLMSLKLACVFKTCALSRAQVVGEYVVCCCSGVLNPIRIPKRRTAGWFGVDRTHLRWLVALGALARGACDGAEREVLARVDGGSDESSRVPGTELVRKYGQPLVLGVAPKAVVTYASREQMQNCCRDPSTGS
jgi:hypothetical protein